MKYIIELLADRPSAIPRLANLFIDEWAPWYGPGGNGNAKSDLTECMNRGRLPIAVVAENEDRLVLGTAALKQESLGSEHGFGPWLAAFVVAPEFRGKGIGLSLIQAVEEQAQRLSIKQIFTSTDTANSIIEKREWERLRQTAQSLRGPVSIYSKILK
jgi:GNAT superfamily N-acetyltransferase